MNEAVGGIKAETKCSWCNGYGFGTSGERCSVCKGTGNEVTEGSCEAREAEDKAAEVAYHAITGE